MILFIDLLLLKSRTLDRCLYAQRLDNSCELFIIPLISVLQNYSSHRLWLIHFACTSRMRSITSWRSGLWFCRRARRFPCVAVDVFNGVAAVCTPARPGIMYKPHSTMLVHTALKSISTSLCLQPTSRRRSCHSPFSLADRPGIFVLSDRDNIREMHNRESRPRNFDGASGPRFAKTNEN